MNIQQIRLRAAIASDPGRVQVENQDSFLSVPEQGLFIVSDGMGGHQAGEVASQTVVSFLPSIIRQKAKNSSSLHPQSAVQIIKEGIAELSEQIRVQGAREPWLEGMGATVALAWMPQLDGVAHLAHLGDSRIYLWRHDRLQQLTEDHNLLALLFKHGEISRDDQRNHPARNQLSRYLGMDGEASPEVKTITLKDRDLLLLCSDGLTNMVTDDEIVAILENEFDLNYVSRSLINAANAAGGNDNITVILVKVQLLG